MIVCLKCGARNRDDAEWCARCRTYLEYDGERVQAATTAPPAEAAVPAKRGLIKRIKTALARGR